MAWLYRLGAVVTYVVVVTLGFRTTAECMHTGFVCWFPLAWSMAFGLMMAAAWPATWVFGLLYYLAGGSF
jgi:hypothetical protein